MDDQKSIGGWSSSHPIQNIRGEILAWRRFWQTYRHYTLLASPGKEPQLKHLRPYLYDDTGSTYVEPVYFYQDCWAFEKIIQRHPALHVDVGSQHKFVALLSKVLPVTMIDIRPLSVQLESLSFKKGSILELPFDDESVSSLSSLCVIEHIGLGRYGDLIDPVGSEKALSELSRVLAPEGHLYISVPVGDEDMVVFNGERVFSLDYLFELFPPLEVVEQRFIVKGVFKKEYQHSEVFSTTGLFELIKQ